MCDERENKLIFVGSVTYGDVALAQCVATRKPKSWEVVSEVFHITGWQVVSRYVRDNSGSVVFTDLGAALEWAEATIRKKIELLEQRITETRKDLEPIRRLRESLAEATDGSSANEG